MWIAGILLCQECTHQRRNLVNLLVEREVPGVQDMYLRLWHIALVGKRAAIREGGVPLAPDDEHQRLVLAQALSRGGHQHGQPKASQFNSG